MNTGKHGMKIIFLLTMAVALWAGNPAMAFDPPGMPGGERGAFCDLLYDISMPTVSWGKAEDADSSQYIFNFRMTYGKNDKLCGNETPTVVNAKAIGTWEGTQGKAYEDITLTSADSRIITSIAIAATCPKNPWISSDFVGCVPIRIEYNGFQYRFNEGMKFPVTALYLGRAGREQLAAKYTWGTGSFVLPPTKPPQVCVGICGSDNYKFGHGENAKIDIHKPSDGSPEWYKTGQYDVEFEYKKSGKMAIADWTKKTLVTSVPAAPDITSFTVPYVNFFTDPVENWTITTIGDKKYRQFRVHARAHGIAPWSEWRSFLMEIPKTAFVAPSTGTSKPVPKLK